MLSPLAFAVHARQLEAARVLLRVCFVPSFSPEGCDFRPSHSLLLSFAWAVQRQSHHQGCVRLVSIRLGAGPARRNQRCAGKREQQQSQVERRGGGVPVRCCCRCVTSAPRSSTLAFTDERVLLAGRIGSLEKKRREKADTGDKADGSDGAHDRRRRRRSGAKSRGNDGGGKAGANGTHDIGGGNDGDGSGGDGPGRGKDDADDDDDDDDGDDPVLISKWGKVRQKVVQEAAQAEECVATVVVAGCCAIVSD